MLDWLILVPVVVLLIYLFWPYQYEPEEESVEVPDEVESYPPHPFRDDIHQ